ALVAARLLPRPRRPLLRHRQRVDGLSRRRGGGRGSNAWRGGREGEREEGRKGGREEGRRPVAHPCPPRVEQEKIPLPPSLPPFLPLSLHRCPPCRRRAGGAGASRLGRRSRWGADGGGGGGGDRLGSRQPRGP